MVKRYVGLSGVCVLLHAAFRMGPALAASALLGNVLWHLVRTVDILSAELVEQGKPAA